MRIILVQNPLAKTNNQVIDTVNAIAWKESIEVISTAIHSLGHTAGFLPADSDLESKIHSENPDLIFLQSFRADPGQYIFKAQEIFERLGIPYTSSPLSASLLARDKYRAKTIFRDNDLPTAAFALVDPEKKTSRKPDNLAFPLFIKPISTGSSQGIHADNPVYTDDAYERVVRETLAFVNLPLLVETFISGREFTVGILGNDPAIVLPIREFIDLQPSGSGVLFRSFSGKADKVMKEHTVCPADISDEKRELIASLAVRAFKALGCADYGRVDFRCDETGNPFLLEINVHPSLRYGSSFPEMAALHGLTYPQTIHAIIQAAVARYPDQVQLS
jgi:D-alanine-D-alanine ligase